MHLRLTMVEIAPSSVIGLMSHILYLVRQPLLDLEAYMLGTHGASPTRVFVSPATGTRSPLT